MSENGENEELKAIKVLAKSRYPEDKTIIDLIKTNEEMVDFVKQKKKIKDESQDQNDKDPPKSKDLGTVWHRHVKEFDDEKDPSDDEGSVDLSKTGGKIPLQSFGEKPKTWKNHEEMIDDLFRTEALAKIESTRRKPDAEIIAKGEKATSMIEKLYKSGMEQNRLTKARKDLVSGRIELSEPEWIRKILNPLGRKNPKEKPFLRG